MKQRTKLIIIGQRLLLLLVLACMAGFRAQAATVYFNQVYQGAGNNYTQSSSRLNNISPLAGIGFHFTSLNPDAPSFQYDAGGNNIQGTLNYVNNSGTVISISGVISRLDKVSGIVTGLYFVNPADGTAYLLVIPVPESNYSTGTNVNTSSESALLGAINNTITAQQSIPLLSIADTSAQENAGHMVFKVVISPAATSTYSFTPTLTAGTATNADFTTALEYNTGNGWQPVSGAISVPASVTTLLIRTPITDDNLVEGNETFILNSGIITGGGILNNQGTFARATIFDNDGTPAPITQPDVTYTYGHADFVLAPSSANTTGAYSYSITGVGSVVTQQGGRFTIIGIGTTQVTIYQAPGGGYGAGSLVVNVTVLPAPLRITANNKSKVYDGAFFTGGNGVTYSGFVYNETAAVLTGTLSYGGTAQNAAQAGTYTISPSGYTAPNYTIDYVDGTLEITKAPLVIRAADDVITYNGQAYTGGNGFTHSGFVAGENLSVLQGAISYGGTAQGAINTGTYDITPSGFLAVNYTINYISGTLTISPAPLTIAAYAQSKVYDGQVFNGVHGVSYSGFAGNDNASNALSGTLAYAGNWQSARGAGTYDIVPGGVTAANYIIDFVVSPLIINKARLTATVGSKTKSYDGQHYQGGYTIAFQGFVSGESFQTAVTGTVAYGGTAQTAVNAGVYAISAGGLSAANYTISYVPGVLTISKAALLVAVSNDTKTYDGQPYSGGPGVTYSGFVAGEGTAVLGGSLLYGGTAQNATNEGAYTLTASGLSAANYAINYTAGALTIQPAVLDVIVSDLVKTYDGRAFGGGNGVSYSGFVGGETAAIVSGIPVFGGAAQGASNVGMYSLSASGVTAPNYTINYVSGFLTIQPAPLVITAVAQSKVYDGQPFGGTHAVTYNGFVGGETAAVLSGNLVYNGNWQSATSTGSYVIDPAGQAASNYTITYVPENLTINPATLIVTVDNKTKTYDGQAYSSGYSTSVQGFVAGETYGTTITGAVSYGGNAQTAVNAGTYTITAGGLSAANYTISYVPGVLTIGKAALVITANDATKTYDGQAYTGGAGVSYAGFVAGETAAILGGSAVYGGTSQGAVNAGTYTITASGFTADNYAISYTPGTFRIDPAALIATAVSGVKTYDGTAFGGGNGISYQGFVGGDTEAVLTGNVVYGGMAQGAKDAGTYSLSASGLSALNYAISYVPGTLTITPAPLTITAAAQNKVYDRQHYSGTHTVAYSGFVAGEAPDVLSGNLVFNGSWQTATGVGTYTIEPAGLSGGNYTISFVQGVLAIRPATLTVTADSKAKTYDGRVYSSGYTASVQGFVSGDTYATSITGTISYNGAAQTAINAGVYTISATGLSAANYTINYITGTLTINKAQLAISVQHSTKTYNGQAYAGGNGVQYTGFVPGENASVLSGQISYGGSAQGAVNTGTYTITAGGLSAANYQLSYTAGTLSITPAVLTATVINHTKTYNGIAYRGGNGIAYSGFAAADDASVIVGNPVYGGTAQGAINKGTYTLSASGLSAPNYTINYISGTLTISPAPLTIAAYAQSKVYDGQVFNGVHGVSYSGFAGNDNASNALSGTLAYAGNWQSARGAGTYDIVPGGVTAANYVIHYTPGQLVINKAPLQVKANDQVKTYDGLQFPASRHAVSYRGFVPGEDISSLAGTLVYGGTAGAATGAGIYTISPAGLQSANYAITYIDGVLTINKAPLIVSADAQSKTYDGTPFPASGYTVSYSGFVAGDGASNAISGTATYGGTAKNAINAGTYTIIPGGLTAANYSIHFDNGPLTIAKAAPVIRAFPDMVRTYGDADFVLTPPQSNSTGAFSYAGSNEKVGKTGGVTITITGVGAASITAMQDADSNFNAGIISATLTVKKAPLVVKANHAFRCIGAANPKLTYSISGFVKGEKESVLAAAPMARTDATESSAAGIYPITASGAEAANYSFSYVAANLRVNNPIHQPVQMTAIDITTGESAQLAARPFGIAYQWLPAAGFSGASSATPVVSPKQDQEYTVQITENTGCTVIDKVKVRVFKDAGVYVPTGFSPNGDGNNDVLRVVGPGIKLQYFRVFNRWGQLIFETTDGGKGWDGRFKGVVQPQDTYVWVLMAAEKNGRVLSQKGFVVLVR